MTEKQCSKCSEIKTLDSFNKCKRGLGGRKSHCRKCQSKYRAEYHKRRYRDPEYRQECIENAIKWVKRNPEKRAEIAKRRNQKERECSPEKVRARALVNQRVRFKRMPKASDLLCCVCNKPAAHYHHHKGYEFKNRYDVVPVCHPCHAILG